MFHEVYRTRLPTPLVPSLEGRLASLFWFFWLLGNYVFKKVSTTFLPKKCNNGHKLFPSSDELVVGSYRLACSIKSTAPDYPPLWSPPERGGFRLCFGFVGYGRITFSERLPSVFYLKCSIKVTNCSPPRRG